MSSLRAGSTASPTAFTISRRGLLTAGLAATAVGLVGCSGGPSGSNGKAASLDGKDSGAMQGYAVGQQFKATEPLTFTLMFQDNPAYPYKKSWEIFDDIADKTNITLKPTVIPFADYDQKRSLMISSGKAPAIIAKTYPGQESQFVGGGAILPVSDYTEKMPNFTDKVKKWKLDKEIDGLRQADGKYYVLPGLHQTLFTDYTLAVRTDVFEAEGIDIPGTWEELQTALAALKKAHPKSQPFSDRFSGDSTLNLAAVSFGTAAGWGLGNGLMFDDQSQKFYFFPARDEYRQLLTYFHGLVSDGLLDPESFTQEDDAAQQKFVTGKSFVINTNAQTLQIYRTAMDKTLGKGKYKIAKIPVPAGPKGKLIGGSRLENGIMISTKAADQDDFGALIQFVDWLWYSDAGEAFVKWGIKDKMWTESDGKYTLKKKYSNKDYGINPNGKIDIRHDLGFSCGNFTYGGSTELVDSTMDDEELAWQKSMASYTQVEPSPGIPYTATERQQASLRQTPLTDAVSTATLNFILGKKPLSDWDSYVSGLKAKGMQTYVDAANKAYEKAHAKS